MAKMILFVSYASASSFVKFWSLTSVIYNINVFHWQLGRQFDIAAAMLPLSCGVVMKMIPHEIVIILECTYSSEICYILKIPLTYRYCTISCVRIMLLKAISYSEGCNLFRNAFHMTKILADFYCVSFLKHLSDWVSCCFSYSFCFVLSMLHELQIYIYCKDQWGWK